MGVGQGVLVGVGVGPGDPDLVTLRAVHTLERAALVLAPSLDPAQPGRAEAVVREVVPKARIQRVVMPMGALDRASAAQRRRRSAEAVADDVLALLDEGGLVAWVTLGDPGIYSTFWLLARAVQSRRQTVGVEVVPGIVAFSALAARASVELLDDEEYMLLATGRARWEVVESALDDPRCGLVLYKPGELLGRTKLAGRALGRRGVVGSLLGTPQATVRTLEEADEEATAYLTTVIVPPERGSR